jgi:hypothetical protein
MQLTQIWRHPVKSLQGESLTTADVESTGLAFDRAVGIINDATGKILTARREPQLLFASATMMANGELMLVLPNGGTHRHMTAEVGDPAVNAALSEWIGRPVHLASAIAHELVTAESYSDAVDETSALTEWQLPPGRFVDAAPVLLITTQTLESGARTHPSGRWDIRRFRPNLVIDASGTEWLEDGWVSMHHHIGQAEIRVRKPCGRCTMITRAQPGIEADREVFKSLAPAHGATFGVLCDVVTSGAIRIGDELRFDEEQRVPIWSGIEPLESAAEKEVSRGILPKPGHAAYDLRVHTL